MSDIWLTGWLATHTTVARLRQEILQTTEGYAPNTQMLLFAGNRLQDDRTMADYNIQKETTLFLMLRLSYAPHNCHEAVHHHDVTN